MRQSSDASHLERLDIERAEGDLLDAASLRRACEEVDIVVHTAASVGSYGEWEHFHEVGVLGTQRLIDAAHEAGVARFIHISSIAVYGFKEHASRPHEDTPFQADAETEAWNHYVREKVMAEQLLWKAHEEGKIKATALRPVVVSGARELVHLGRPLANSQSARAVLADLQIRIELAERLHARALWRLAAPDLTGIDAERDIAVASLSPRRGSGSKG